MSEAFKAAKKDKNTLAALDSAVSMVANSAQEKTAHETSKPVVSMSINSVPQNPRSVHKVGASVRFPFFETHKITKGVASCCSSLPEPLPLPLSLPICTPGSNFLRLTVIESQLTF
jgi:hypothetical protein